MSIQTFTYKENFSPWVFTPAFVFFALTTYAFIEKVSFSFKGRVFLEYPYSYYVPGVLGFLFIIYAIYKFIKASKSGQNQKPISLGESFMSFPKGATDSITINYRSVNELWVKDDNDDGESVILYTDDNKNRYEFFEDNFENETKYIAFKTFLEKNCTNITNRD